MEYETTFRLVALGDRNNVGQHASTADLALLAPGNLERRGNRLGLERTEWAGEHGKMTINRTILIAAEDHPNEWAVGAS